MQIVNEIFLLKFYSWLSAGHSEFQNKLEETQLKIDYQK